MYLNYCDYPNDISSLLFAVHICKWKRYLEIKSRRCILLSICSKILLVVIVIEMKILIVRRNLNWGNISNNILFNLYLKSTNWIKFQTCIFASISTLSWRVYFCHSKNEEKRYQLAHMCLMILCQLKSSVHNFY